MRRFVLLLLLSSCCNTIVAQFNDTVTHHVRFGASGNLNRSNDATAYLLNHDARFSIRNRRTSFNTAANWLYGQQNSRLTNNDFTSTTDFNLYRNSSNLYYWALASYTTSLSLRIRNQLQSGLGVAYNILNSSNAWLNISEGVLYETSILATDDPALNRYHTFRNSFRLAYKFIIGKALTLSGNNFHQQAFHDGGDYIIRTSNSLSIKLSSWIGIGSTLTYNQYRRTGTNNLLLTYGLVMEKYY